MILNTAVSKALVWVYFTISSIDPGNSVSVETLMNTTQVSPEWKCFQVLLSQITTGYVCSASPRRFPSAIKHTTVLSQYSTNIDRAVCDSGLHDSHASYYWDMKFSFLGLVWFRSYDLDAVTIRSCKILVKTPLTCQCFKGLVSVNRSTVAVNVWWSSAQTLEALTLALPDTEAVTVD